MKKYSKVILLTSFFVLIASFLIYNSFSYLDCDLGWHLLIGKETIENKAVAQTENHIFPILGTKWVDHEWLLNVLFYFIYNNFGYIFLSIVFVILGTISFFLLAYLTKKYFLPQGASWVPLLFMVLIGVFASSPHMGVRMQEIAVLFIILLVFLLHSFSLNKNKRILFWIPLIFFLWANLHGSFPIGFFVIGLWIIFKSADVYLSNKKISWVKKIDNINFRDIGNVIALTFIGLIATLINPYGLKLYSFLFEYSNTYYLKRIMEWQPAFYLPIVYWQFFYLAMTASFILLFLYFVHKKTNGNGTEQKIDLFYFGVTIIFFILALKSKRHFPLFFATSFPFMSGFLYENFPIPDNFKKYIPKKKYTYAFLSFVFLLLAINFLISAKINDSPFDHKYCEFFPCGAVDYLNNNPEYDNARIYNTYGWGGYLLWERPDKQLFIDGKMPFILYKGHSFLEEYYDFRDPEKQEARIKENKIDLFLLQEHSYIKLNWFEKNIFGYDEKKVNEKDGLVKFLESSPEWKKIYNDATSIIFVRKNYVN